MEKLVYQMFILGTGEKLKYALKRGLGGVIFFTRDIQTKNQFATLIKEIKSEALVAPFLSIDQEGGRVERTENIHPRYLSPKFAYQKGESFVMQQSDKIADELKDYGINLNFAPCADVNTNPNNPIIGERSFSSEPEIVSKCVKITANEFRKKGIIPCIKHFPGHGDADKDSHLTLPCIDLPLTKMENIHIKPFRENIDIEMIMVAHLYCTCFDKNIIPASLSKNAINYLRKALGYNGIVITDDMVMKGVQDFGTIEACKKAIMAGVDMFIYRDADKKNINIINSLILEIEKDEQLKARVIEANERIKGLKNKYNI